MPPLIHSDVLSTAMLDDMHKVLSIVSSLPKWSCAADDGSSDFDALVQTAGLDRKGVVKLLLEKGSRVIKQGNAALHKSVAQMGWSSVVEKLLELGAGVGDKNCHGDTALHLAFLNGATDRVVDLLLANYLSETTANVENDDGLSFLHIACARSSVTFVRQFTDRGMDDIDCQVNLHNDSKYAGYAPLHFAVVCRRHEIVKLLLNSGASIYVQDGSGSTAVHLALYNADQPMIDLLFARDERYWNCANDSGLTHFMAACAGSTPHVVERFLHERPAKSHLVDSQARDSRERRYAGYSPIHFATEFGSLEAVQVLLDNGASCFQMTVDNWSPMALARCTGREDIQLLLEKYSTRETEKFLTDKVSSNGDVNYKWYNY